MFFNTTLNGCFQFSNVGNKTPAAGNQKLRFFFFFFFLFLSFSQSLPSPPPDPTMMVRSSVVVLVVFVVVACGSRPIPSNYTPVCDGACANAEVKHIGMNKVMPLKEVEFNYCRFMGHCPTTMKAVTLGAEVCSGGSVDVHQNENGMGAYDCSNVDLMSYVAAADLGSSGDTSDIWGATIVDVDGEGTDKYVAIVGHSGL